MIPFELELLTAILIASVAVILSSYLWVLKKNGWISNFSHQMETNSREKPSPNAKERDQSATDKERRKPDESKQSSQVAEQEEKKDNAETDEKTFLKNGLAQKLIEAQKSSQVQEVPPSLHPPFWFPFFSWKKRRNP